MASEGVRPFGPTALVTMMKCRLNREGLCCRHESVDSPGLCVPSTAIVPTHSGLSGENRREERREVGENECYISSFLL